MRTIAIIALLAPLACHAGSVLGGDITTSTIASSQAKKINTPRPAAPAQPVYKRKSKDELRREAQRTLDAARRERERRGGVWK